MVIAFVLLACDSPAPEAEAPPDPSCQPDAIDLLAQRHGLTLVFAPCGSNEIVDAAWSPTGHELYWQQGMTQKILHADRPDKLTEVVPTPTANGPAVFVSARRVVHATAAVDVDSPPRLAWWDLDTPRSTDPANPTVGKTVTLPAGWSAVADLQRTRDEDHVLLTAVAGGSRKVWRVELSTGAVEEPWPFLGAVDSFTYTPAADAVVTTTNGAATWWDAAAGKQRGTWSPATRGVVHPRGTWLMLEHEGPKVSAFGPDDPRAAEKELTLPEGERTLRPPMLSFVDLRSGNRYEWELVQGSQFEWYETTDYYGSFTLWGFQRTRARRNVVLVDFLERMTGAEIGAVPHGVRQVGEKEGFLGALTPP